MTLNLNRDTMLPACQQAFDTSILECEPSFVETGVEYLCPRVPANTSIGLAGVDISAGDSATVDAILPVYHAPRTFLVVGRTANHLDLSILLTN